jgi:hypothetical protein
MGSDIFKRSWDGSLNDINNDLPEYFRPLIRWFNRRPKTVPGNEEEYTIFTSVVHGRAVLQSLYRTEFEHAVGKPNSQFLEMVSMFAMFFPILCHMAEGFHVKVGH